jgi:flagella basal body P-ring formation protein FlgA
VSDIVRDCKEELCSLAVAMSPLPGRTKTVERHDVEAAIRLAGFNTASLNMPTRVRVTRPSAIASTSTLKQKIEDAVIAILPSNVVLDEIGTVSEVETPKAGFEVRARLTGDSSFHRRVSIAIDYLSNGTKFRTAQVSALLALEADIPTAVRDLNVGDIINDRDVQWKKVRLDTEPSELAVSTAEIVGRQVDAFVPSGAPFPQRSLKRIPVIKEGERLTLESVFGLVRVAALGVSRQDGAVGDRVRVILLSDSRLVWAQISGPGRAVVVP